MMKGKLSHDWDTYTRKNGAYVDIPNFYDEFAYKIVNSLKV